MKAKQTEAAKTMTESPGVLTNCEGQQGKPLVSQTRKVSQWALETLNRSFNLNTYSVLSWKIRR